MIVLDTNVISALMKSNPDPVVVAWLDSQPSESIWTTSVCVFEVLFGLEVMAKGKRRRLLRQAFEQVLKDDLNGRVLDLDSAAAACAATISGELKTAGRPVEIRDVLIAGIVVARRGVLATGNCRHFEDTGASIVNPWDTAE